MRTKSLLLILFLAIGIVSMAQTVPDNWYLDEVNPGEDFALSPDTEFTQDGEVSCHMVLLQPEVPYLISDNYDVNAGDPYTFSIHYYDNDDRASLKFYAEFYDAEGNDIYGEDPVYSEDGDMWQQVTWDGVVPDGAVEGYVWIKLYDDEGYVDMAEVWVDNAVFQVEGVNLVENGSFEEWEGLGDAEVVICYDNLVYPNPVQTDLHVIADADEIQIMNTMGQVVRNAKIGSDKSITVSMSDLDNGIYLVSLLKNNSRIFTDKFLKY